MSEEDLVNSVVQRAAIPRAAIPRAVRLLDCSRPLSEALCEILVAGREGPSGSEPFDFARTMVLVPGGRLGQAIERRLIARARAAGQPLLAPTVVTPLMLGSRFVVPERPVLSSLSARLSWRAALERVQRDDAALAADVARIFQADPELPASTRARLADRLHRLSSDVASAMHSFASLARHPEVLAQASVAERIAVLGQVERVREVLLDQAQVADRDGALRDAVQAGRIDAGSVDRVVVLLADPEPVQRMLLARLGESGVRVEVCVHTDASLDRDGFPLLDAWESRGFGIDRIPADAIEVAEGPTDAADAVIAALRSLPSPRLSDEIAVMAPDDETRRSIERAVVAADSRVAGAARRAFAATRMGTLLASLSELVDTANAESLAGFVRHPDVARWLADRGIRGAADAVSEYRAETLAGSWRDAVVDRGAGRGNRRFEAIARTFGAVQAAVFELTKPLEAERPATEWGPALRDAVRQVVGEDRSGAFEGERAATIYSLDRALGALAATPAACAVPLGCAEAIALVLGEASRRAIRANTSGTSAGDDGRAGGLSLIGWLDAGMADERHLILAGFADGAVPEGAVTDAVLPDDIRRVLGMASGLRRAARDCWILDGVVQRARARAGASLRFVVPRRTAEGDPLRPSRFLLRTDVGDLPARASLLFSEHGDGAIRATAVGSPAPVAFPRTPPVAVRTIRSVRVTAFKTFIQCPYLFQLQIEPRLRLGDLDERAAELDARAFGTLVHAATEAWGREEIATGARTEDSGVIECALHAHLDAHVRASFPKSVLASVRVQVELARRRLSRFARLQAEEAKAGWRVHAVEMSFAAHADGGAYAAPRFPQGASVEGETVLLTGRIDRVDIHEATGVVRALDYKTSSRPESPAKTHLIGRGPKKGEWKDLQLPLYRVLLRSLPQPLLVGGDGLGYINLAPNAEHSKFAFLGAPDEALEKAEAAAAAIVARILAGDFAPSARVPVRAGDAFAPIWGLGMRGVEPEAGAVVDVARGVAEDGLMGEANDG